jgi:hypothetical protein
MSPKTVSQAYSFLAAYSVEFKSVASRSVIVPIAAFRLREHASDLVASGLAPSHIYE